MPGINRQWHAAHRVPKNPKLQARVAWHGERAAACGCRAMLAALATAHGAQGGS